MKLHAKRSPDGKTLRLAARGKKAEGCAALPCDKHTIQRAALALALLALKRKR